MGNLCGRPMTLNEEGLGSEPERGRLDLVRQLSYDIYKIPGAQVDWRNDFEESHLSRRDSKRYYGVKKSPITQIHSQLHSSSFGSRSSAGTTATTSNWTRSQRPSSTELEDLTHVQELHTETPSPSISRASASSSGTSAFESNQNLQSPPSSPPPELVLERSAGVEQSHGSSPSLQEGIPESTM